MKKILFTFSFLAAFLAGYSQMSNSGGIITVETGATLVIEGDYTSSASGNIIIDGNVNLKGNFVNNSGTVDAGSDGTLNFVGAAPQQIGGTASTTFNCLVVVNNGGNGVSLTGADEVLTKALTLTSGKLTLNAFDLTMAAVGISVSTGNYVVTNNAAGELKGTVAATPVTFPVGTASSYNPVILANAGTSDMYGVVYTAALPAGYAPTEHGVTGNWAISELVPTGSNLTVTPQWNPSQELPSFDRTDCAVGVSNGTSVTWAAGGAAVANGSAWTRVGSPFTTLGAFVVGDYFFEGIDLDLDVMLAGPYNAGSMSTALNALIPPNDPYGNGIIGATVPATAVDWIEVELRSAPNVLAKSYSFFLDNGGNVRNIDGVVGAKLTGIAKGSYYVAVRHRNHLGAMTAAPINFAAAGPFAFNFKTGTGIYGTNAMRNISGTYALWAGDANGDNKVIYQGSGNDPGPIANEVASYSTSFLYVVQDVYSNNDINMDGDVIYQGGGNDPTPVGNSVSNHPLNTGNAFLYVVNGQLPLIP